VRPLEPERALKTAKLIGEGALWWWRASDLAGLAHVAAPGLGTAKFRGSVSLLI